MAITASMVKELRDTTGAGMMDAKKALTETDGDMEAAVDWLRTNAGNHFLEVGVFATVLQSKLTPRPTLLAKTPTSRKWFPALLTSL